MTRCGFASSIAAAARVDYAVQLEEFTEADVAQLDGFLDGAGAEHNFAVALFPRVRTPRGIVRMLRALATGSRWSVSRVEWRKHARDGAALVGVTFTTAHGDRSSVMGFAPLGCMPVTRRAPYVALAAWAGGKVNPHKQTSGSNIGFIDGPVVDKDGSVIDAEAHLTLWDTTMGRVKELLGDPVEDDFRLKDVAFCLPETNVSEILPPT